MNPTTQPLFMDFGQYQEKIWEYVQNKDPSYVTWCAKIFDKGNKNKKIAESIIALRKSS